MMQRLCCILLGALTGAIVAFPDAAFWAAEDALTLFLNRVMPSLFPMMMALLLLSSRLPERRGIYALLSLLCGSPAGSRLCAALPPDTPGKLRFAALNGTLSPMFLLSVIPSVMGFSSGIPLLLCHMAGAVFTSFLIPQKNAPHGKAQTKKAPLSLASSAVEAGKSLLIVCGCMVFASVLLSMVRCAMPFLPQDAFTILHLTVEITGGLKALSGSTLPHKELLAVCFSSFGGVSILMQNAAFWQTSGVGMGRLCLYRILHALLSTALYAMIFFP